MLATLSYDALDEYTAMPYIKVMYYEFLRTEAGQIVLVAAYGKNEREDVPRQLLRKLKEHFDEQNK